jgi:FtsP/CotA-like multicopper oxidase with cupredoxin domain
MGPGGGGGGVIDPPVGLTLQEPAVADTVSVERGVVEVNLEAAVTPVTLDGTSANLMTYNGHFPAPTIRVQRGDRLRVHLKNSLPPTTATNLLGCGTACT